MFKQNYSTISVFLLIMLFQNVSAQVEKTFFSDEAEMLYKERKYLELISYCDEQLPTVIKTNDSLAIAKLFLEKARGLYHKSRHLESIEDLKKAETYLPSSASTSVLKADIMYLYHINYALKSFILKELEYGRKSLDLYIAQPKEIKNYEQIFALYRRMANPNVTIGRYEVAVNYLDKADELLDKIPSNYKLRSPLLEQKFSAGYQKIVVDLIETAFFSENYDSISIKPITQRVIREKNKLDTIYENNKHLNINVGSYGSALNFYCRYFIVNQDKIDFNLSELHDDIDKSIALLDKKLNSRYLVLYQGNKVDVLCYEKAYEKALTLMNTIIDEAGESHNRYVNFLFQKARILFSMGKNEEGKAWIKKGIDRIHSGTEPLKSDYSNFEAGYKLEDVYLLISVAEKIIVKAELGKKEKEQELKTLYDLAFQQFLNTYTTQPLNKRTQNVLKTIVRNLVEYNLMDSQRISQIEHIENRLAWKRFSQSRTVAFLPVIDSLEQIDFLLRKQLIHAKRQRDNKKVDSLNTVLFKFNRQLQNDYPTLAKFTQDNFTISEFQQLLPQDEIVLKYMFFKDEFGLFRITKNDIKVMLKPWGFHEKEILNTFIEQTKQTKISFRLSDTLTKLLLPEEVENYGKLTIIPDTPIYQLPFEVLGLNKKFLVEEKAIRYSSHLRFVHVNDNIMQEDTKAEVSIFAPEYPKKDVAFTTRSVPYSLEGAQEEAQAIKEIFRTTAFIGEEATKDQFIAHKSDGSVLHLAMHATMDEEYPEFSHFNFPKNEKLYVEELYALKIPVELAVLGACNTALGKQDNALNLKSLHRAFSFSGTKATIASLWEVPDMSTKTIMVDFYKNLKKGKTKSEALQRAKINYLRETDNPKLRHPYYWAGFVLYGDDTPVTHLSKSYLIFIFGGIAIAGLAFQYLRRRRKKAA